MKSPIKHQDLNTHKMDLVINIQIMRDSMNKRNNVSYDSCKDFPSLWNMLESELEVLRDNTLIEYRASFENSKPSLN